MVLDTVAKEVTPERCTFVYTAISAAAKGYKWCQGDTDKREKAEEATLLNDMRVQPGAIRSSSPKSLFKIFDRMICVLKFSKNPQKISGIFNNISKIFLGFLEYL